jgi:hypothetical protein
VEVVEERKQNRFVGTSDLLEGIKKINKQNRKKERKEE